MIEFVVYSRLGCHLCEDLLQQLVVLQQSHEFNLQVVDIDKDAQLVERYGLKVPVVTYLGEELCRYFLDLVSIKRVLADK